MWAALLSLAVASVVAKPTPRDSAGSNKRGISSPYYNGPIDVTKLQSGASFIYDYETYSPPVANGIGSLQYIGMQRCLDCDSSPIAQLASRQQQLGFQIVFTLNEPDINGITPSQAADWYKQYINPLRIQKSLPAVTSSSSSGQGLDWLSQFISSCAGECYYDFINLHWYGPDFGSFQAFVNKAQSQFSGTKIVITEFALQNPSGGQADQVAFFQQAFSWLDGQDSVAQYYPFVGTSPSLFSQNDANGAAYVGTGSCLFNNDGSVSAVGELFLS